MEAPWSIQLGDALVLLITAELFVNHYRILGRDYEQM